MVVMVMNVMVVMVVVRISGGESNTACDDPAQ